MSTSPNGPDLIVVGCGKQKLTHPAPARDLYTSQFFKAKARYALASGCPWVILSAEYGLVMPGEMLEPYDSSLKSQGEWGRYWFRWKVRLAFGRLAFERNQRVVVELHAGKLYREQFKEAVSKKHKHVEYIEPTAGMGIGYQLGWYKREAA